MKILLSVASFWYAMTTVSHLCINLCYLLTVSTSKGTKMRGLQIFFTNEMRDCKYFLFFADIQMNKKLNIY